MGQALRGRAHRGDVGGGNVRGGRGDQDVPIPEVLHEEGVENPEMHPSPDQDIFGEEVPDLRAFCTRPVPIGDRVLCRIIRRKDGVRKLYPRYELYLEPTRDEETGLMSGSVFLMSATKRRRTGPSHYTITLTRGQRVGGKEDVVGKVR